MALTNHKPIVGIIGGMGPMATCDLFNKVIHLTTAEKDQEHVHLIIDNNTDIPDRSAHILGNGPDPVPEMKKAVTKLIFDGAEVLAMPCNTAHFYYERLVDFAKDLKEDIRFVHMIEETAEHCKRQDHKKVMLLATQGTYASDIYKAPFEERHIELFYPSKEEREAVMAAIYAYKCGQPVETEIFNTIATSAKKQGISAMILGCTELPLIAGESETFISLVDPTAILAKTLSSLK